MLDIRRSGAYDRVVSQTSWESIRAFEEAAADYFFQYVERGGGLKGENYAARIGVYQDIPEVLRSKVGNVPGRYFIETRRSKIEAKTLLTTLNLDSGQGYQLQVHDNPNRPDEEYPLDEEWCIGLGINWLGDLFGTADNEELKELVGQARRELLDPRSLSCRTGSEVGSKAIPAEIVKQLFRPEHLSGLISLYDEVAFSDLSRRSRNALSGHELQAYYDDLKSGESIGFRTGTQHLDCAKHLFVPGDGHIATHLSLNYAIGVGPVNLYFAEDLEMADEYSRQAGRFLVEHAVATPATLEALTGR